MKFQVQFKRLKKIISYLKNILPTWNLSYFLQFVIFYLTMQKVFDRLNYNFFILFKIEALQGHSIVFGVFVLL